MSLEDDESDLVFIEESSHVKEINSEGYDGNFELFVNNSLTLSTSRSYNLRSTTTRRRLRPLVDYLQDKLRVSVAAFAPVVVISTSRGNPDHHRTHNKLPPLTATLTDQELVSVRDRVASSSLFEELEELRLVVVDEN
ncbi:hypothetical protein ACFE04_021289 [Oxalis oulophora]